MNDTTLISRKLLLRKPVPFIYDGNISKPLLTRQYCWKKQVLRGTTVILNLNDH